MTGLTQDLGWRAPLIVGNTGNGTVSGFVLHPLGGSGLPEFQPSYP
jgi:hypothetical protein